jgi:Flp pilus assembly protein TadB
MEYNVNKGIGRSVEFRGLKSHYLFLFAGGLLAVFVVVAVLVLAGIPQVGSIGFGVVAACVLVWLTFRLNARYGEHGLMKRMARRQHPRFLVNRRHPRRFFPPRKREEASHA